MFSGGSQAYSASSSGGGGTAASAAAARSPAWSERGPQVSVKTAKRCAAGSAALGLQTSRHEPCQWVQVQPQQQQRLCTETPCCRCPPGSLSWRSAAVTVSVDSRVSPGTPRGVKNTTGTRERTRSGPPGGGPTSRGTAGKGCEGGGWWGGVGHHCGLDSWLAPVRACRHLESNSHAAGN